MENMRKDINNANFVYCDCYHWTTYTCKFCKV